MRHYFRGLTKFDENVYNESVKLALQEEDPINERERKVLPRNFVNTFVYLVLVMV